MRRLLLLAVLVLGIGCSRSNDDVCADAIKQYEIAERVGDRTMSTAQAGVVAMMYLQLQDESGYRRWLNVQSMERLKMEKDARQMARLIAR